MSSLPLKQSPILCKQDATDKRASALLITSDTHLALYIPSNWNGRTGAATPAASHPSCFFSPHCSQTFREFSKIYIQQINNFLKIMP